MMKTMADPQSIVFSVRIYRVLVAAYPSSFRSEYGKPMVQAFRDSARQASREGGVPALLALWGRNLALNTIRITCAAWPSTVTPT